MHVAGLIAVLAASAVSALRLRGDVGCTAGSPCLTFEPVPDPDKMSPATVGASIGDDGFLVADSVEGIDPAEKKEMEKDKDGDNDDPAAKYLVKTPVVAPPPPPAKFEVCPDYDRCPSLPPRP